MSPSPRPRVSRFEPTWRRLGAGTAGLFLVIVAFLAGRMRAGADPALATSTSNRAQQPPAQLAPPQAQPDPGYGDPAYGDPYGDEGAQSAPADPNPPTTHAS